MKLTCKWLTAVSLAAMLPGVAGASEVGDRLPQHLYDGTLADIADQARQGCAAAVADACFALGFVQLVGAVEGLSQALYRHGATSPSSPAMAMLLGMGVDTPPAAANPDPEPLSYQQLRQVLEDFVVGIDAAGSHFAMADRDGDFVIPIDPLRVRIDFNGDGAAQAEETLGALLRSAGEFADIPSPDAPPPGTKSKTQEPEPADTTIGFDNADGIWLAGYANAVAAPVDLLLAHDFSEFFDAYLHRVFPRAGLPMQDHSQGGTLFMDADSDAFIADLIAAVHTADFPVTEPERLAGVLERLRSITTLSRRNWELILAETDDNCELVPSPRQTSLVPAGVVTQETVDAWMATLETVDRILAGDLLVPHWRFAQGFDLTAYFETATETDLVMLIAGQGALPFIKDGPVADAESFAEANRVFGTEWLNYVFWFN